MSDAAVEVEAEDVDEFRCADGCRQLVPTKDKAPCRHFDLCVECEDAMPCVECEREDHFYEAVDRAYEAQKGGDDL